MRVAVVAEFYPRSADPVLGVWAHRQAVAARDAGAEIEVFVLHRLVPPAASFTARELGRLVAQPGVEIRDGLTVRYVRYVAPRRDRAYARWGAWAAPALAAALHRAGRFDVVHAHNAVPAGDAIRRARLRAPLVVSVHGGDVLWTSRRVPGGERAVRRTLVGARLVLANSRGVERLAREHGARETRVVTLGTDVPAAVPDRAASPLVVTVGHLVARKRHADVVRAVARLPGVRYLAIGDGPERPALARLARELGIEARVELAGQLDPAEALRRARAAWLFVMPSTEEAFGVAYVEAMAAGVPAIGAAGEPGPEEIGPGLELVPPGDPGALAAAMGRLLEDPAQLARLGAAARANVLERFTWARSGQLTLAAYRDAIR
ncbi:MAG: glycosyltransferase [Actinobacteria bacterium]|nr:glycosyltransferase [Actinomycetota bacterium]